MTLPPIPSRPSTFWGPVLGSQPAGHLREEHEILVVGAGIVGLTTALLLARQGRDVAVVDARRPGGGTSPKSTAKATLLHGTQTSQIRSQHGSKAARRYVEANRSGLQIVREVVTQTGIVDSDIRDTWTYATTAKGARSVIKEHDALAEAGLPVELTAPTELPFSTTEAVRLPDQLQINPAQYLAALHGELTALNVPVVWPHRVAAVQSHRDGLRVTTDHGLSTMARWVVVATLLPFPLRTVMFATSKPMRSYVMACRIQAPLPQGMYLSADSPSHSLRTAVSASGEDFLISGGHGHPTAKQNPTSKHVHDLAQWTHENFQVREFTHRWSAQDYLSVDVLPQVGPSPLGPKGVLMAGGFGKWGITNGSAAAQVLAGTITGDLPDWAQVYHPRIASGLSGWKQLAKTNAEVGVNLAKGWLLEPGLSQPDEGEAAVRRDLPAPQAVSEIDGQRRVCSAVCPHLGGIVRWNDSENSWDCPLHGSRFAADGDVITGPAVQPLDRHEGEAVSSAAE